MKIFNNNYFLFGNLVFIILAIPVAMYLVKSQTTVRSNASSNIQITTNTQNTETTTSTSSQAEVNTTEIASEKSSQTNTKNNNMMFAIIGGVLIVFSIGIFLIAFRS